VEPEKPPSCFSNPILKLSNIEQRSRNWKGKMVHGLANRHPPVKNNCSRSGPGIIELRRDPTPAPVVGSARTARADIGPAQERDSEDGMTITENSPTNLTERERQIARLVSQGLSNKAIGRLLNITDGTIKVHLHHIFQKLEISNRTVLATFAQRSLGSPEVN
jgi:two-component system, NarL family, nitrate/nitrite response regulator NarL